MTGPRGDRGQRRTERNATQGRGAKGVKLAPSFHTLTPQRAQTTTYQAFHTITPNSVLTFCPSKMDGLLRICWTDMASQATCTKHSPCSPCCIMPLFSGLQQSSKLIDVPQRLLKKNSLVSLALDNGVTSNRANRSSRSTPVAFQPARRLMASRVRTQSIG